MQLSQVLSSPLTAHRPPEYSGAAHIAKTSPPMGSNDALSALLGDDAELLRVLRDLKKAVSMQPKLK